MIDDYIRGGQIFLHKVRMFAQVWYNNFFFAIIIALTISSYLFYSKILSIDTLASISYVKALFVKEIDLYTKTSNPTKIAVSSEYGLYSKNIEAAKIITHPFFKKKFEYSKETFLNLIKVMIIISAITSFLILIIWHSFGKLSKKADIISGNKILSAKEVSKILKKSGKASDLLVGDVPLVKDSETSHILLTGTTGTGKTTSMNSLLKQVRAQNNNAVIIDYNGQMSDKFYREGDIIIGKNNSSWDFFEDIKDVDNLSIIANALFEGRGGSNDEMWNNASKTLFKDAASVIARNSNPLVSNLFDLLAKEPLEILHSKLLGCASFSMLDPNNERTALSIRTNCIAYLDWMEQFSGSLNKISISNWIKESDHYQGRWVFLKATPKERTSLKSLYTIIMDLIINQIMELGENKARRIWLVIDELASLRKMPSLGIALSEFRKYGGCIMASLQSPHQLFDIYGQAKAHFMLDQFNTKLIFRTEEYNFANYLCKGFGDLNYIEKSENYSYGSHEIRDGVSISSTQKHKLLLTPNDLASLDNLECYLSLPLREAKISKIMIKQV